MSSILVSEGILKKIFKDEGEKESWFLSMLLVQRDKEHIEGGKCRRR